MTNYSLKGFSLTVELAASGLVDLTTVEPASFEEHSVTIRAHVILVMEGFS